MPRLRTQRTRPIGAVSKVGQLTEWVLRLAFSLVITAALLGMGTAGVSSPEREGEGERGEFGEFGEFGELATELLTETGQDGESGEYNAAYACAARRTHAGSGPQGCSVGRFCVPRVLAPTAQTRTIQRPHGPRRISPADDEEEPQA